MGDHSGIEWTDATWNPTSGCTKITPGCKHCYAKRLFPRVYGRHRKFEELELHPHRLDYPLRWQSPRMIFVNSMSDLFHNDVPFWFVDRVFAVMAFASQHTFQVLTKRSDRMREYLDRTPAGANRQAIVARLMGQPDWISLPRGRTYPRWPEQWPLPNVWLGVSVEDQERVVRIDALRETPAAIRFVSFEPLLCRVTPDLTRIDWAIGGGESGPSARGAPAEWFETLLACARRSGTKFFMKQGSQTPEWPDFKDFDSFPETLRVREFPVSGA